MLEMIVGILLVAIATAILYVWGLKKSLTQKDDLIQILSLKGERKVIQFLKKNNQITCTQVEKEVTKISSSQFYSKRKAVVTDPKTFSKDLLAKMLDKGAIKEEMDRGKKIYKLNIKN